MLRNLKDLTFLVQMTFLTPVILTNLLHAWVVVNTGQPMWKIDVGKCVKNACCQKKEERRKKRVMKQDPAAAPAG